jgi:hypothetical protein
VLVLLVAAAAFYFLKPKGSKDNTAPDQTEKAKDGPKELTEDEKKELADQRKVVLAKLVCPANFPQDVPIYYGSQTGTAEKFA